MTEVTVRFAHPVEYNGTLYSIGQVVTFPAHTAYRFINGGYAVDTTESDTPPAGGGAGGGSGINPAPINPTLKYLRGDLTWQTLDKGAVGLVNVDNTADDDKPLSSAQAAALAAIGGVTPPPATTFENALTA